MQENIADRLLAKIRARMEHLRIGNPLDKAMDIGAIVSSAQLHEIQRLVEQGASEGAHVWQPTTWNCPPQGLFFPPTMLTDVSPASTVAQVEIFGPVLVAMSFRTPEEAVALANNTRYGLAASVWSDNINLALDIAPKLKAGSVWINCTNLFDASSGFGGYRESGYGREGGKEGLYEYIQPAWTLQQLAHPSPTSLPEPITSHKGDSSSHETAPLAQVEELNIHDMHDQPQTSSQPDLGDRVVLPPIDRTPKLFIAGKQVRPDSGYSRPVYARDVHLIGEVGDGNRKDIRNAVEAAHKASSWATTTAHNRAQILYYLAENLEERQHEFAHTIRLQTSCSYDDALVEVQASLSRLFSYAAWSDKYEGIIHRPPLRGVTLAMREPIGVIGLICPNQRPLLGLVSLFAPAIAMGNTVVAVPSEQAPLSATAFYQVLETSDVPAGVVNIVTGAHEVLGLVLAEHHDVSSIWSFSDTLAAAQVETASTGNMKRTWVDRAPTRDWLNVHQSEGEDFLRESVQVKNIWVPYGE